MLEKGRYTQRDVNSIFRHIPSRTLRWWGLMKFYGWAYEIPDGRGISRIYEVENLYQIGVVEELSSMNIPSSIIKKIMYVHFDADEMPAPIELKDEHQLKERPQGVAEFERVLDELLKKMDIFILVITRTPRLSTSNLGRRERMIYGWHHELILEGEIAEYARHTSIIINLRDIKDRVDNLIKNAA